MDGVPIKKGTDFVGHEFFEASSMWKIYGKYYFIYSSYQNYELCYALNSYPDKDFKYGETLVSLCDEEINATKVNNTGNTHGSILEINDEFYIFYHRQNNRNSFLNKRMLKNLHLQEMDLSKAKSQAVV